MKKIISAVICILMVLNTTVYAKGAENDAEFIVNMSEEMEKYKTYEDPMPLTSYKYDSFVTYSNTELNNWKNNTEIYLEEFYKQEIISVVEDSESIVFTFETDYMNPEEQVENITYFKENSKARAVTGDTKITTLVQWSNGAKPVNVDAKTASNFAAAGSIIIGLCKHVTAKMSAVISSIASYVGWKIDSSLPIKLETRAAVKYTRKVGNYFLSTRVWWPNVQVGRAEYWYYQTAYQPTYTNGPWVPHHKDTIPNAAENNYNVSQNKPHYTDNTWIINKVKELNNTGQVYVDIFE